MSHAEPLSDRDAEPDDRPWERQGGVRRDNEPHRGPFLVLLGTASLICGLLSLCLLAPAVVGLPLAVLTYALAAWDTARMERGTMDRYGLRLAELAQERALIGGLLCLVTLALWGTCLLLPHWGLPWQTWR
jgi:hypothetical protein